MRTFPFASPTLTWVVLSVALAPISCAPEDSSDSVRASAGMGSGGDANSAGSGGSSAAMGGSSSGGVSGSSGAAPTAGKSQTGGAGGSAGMSATGGTSASGGGATGGSTGSGGSDGGSGAAGDAGAGSSSGGGAGMSGGGGTSGSGGLTGAVPSDGCGMATPADGPSAIDVGGSMREYILRLPDSYDPETPHRLVFAFHGAQGSAEQVDNGDPANSMAEPTGPFYGIMDESMDTIFVAGQADGSWDTSSNQDIDYVNAILARLESTLCIDTTRIFATGFSMGALMTINNVGCKMADTFRAIAPMSGSLSDCPGSTPIAYWASHGTEDPTISLSQGEAARDEFVTRNGCDTTTMPSTPDGCVAYQGCTEGHPVSFCTFDGVHVPAPFAGPTIWTFFAQF